MSPHSENRFRRDVAERLHECNRSLCEEWLEMLVGLLGEDERDAFPGDDLLDHVPDLISAIADDLTRPAEESFVNSVVTSKAQELGQLRHAQNASIHQLLREYEYLSRLIDDLVLETALEVGYDVSAKDALATTHRLGSAVRILMRTTVDMFTERYAKTIEDQHERLESFNRMVSHELRDSMHSLRLAAELIGSGDTKVVPRVNALIRESVRRADSVLAGLELLTQVGPSEEQSPILQEIDLRTFVEGLAGELSSQAEAFGVDVRVGALPTVVTDVANLDLVLTNLLSNAIKYSSPERGERWVEVDTVDEVVDGTLTLRVRDNGVGISEADLPRVFDRGRRGSAADMANVSGNGLGLYIVKRCVEAMGGEVYVKSVVGDGTAVYCVVPAEPVSAANPPG